MFLFLLFLFMEGNTQRNLNEVKVSSFFSNRLSTVFCIQLNVSSSVLSRQIEVHTKRYSLLLLLNVKWRLDSGDGSIFRSPVFRIMLSFSFFLTMRKRPKFLHLIFLQIKGNTQLRWIESTFQVSPSQVFCNRLSKFQCVILRRIEVPIEYSF